MTIRALVEAAKLGGKGLPKSLDPIYDIIQAEIDAAAGGAGAQRIILQEVLPGSAGDMTVNVDNIRPINTVLLDETSAVTIDTGDGLGLFTLPAGSYVVNARFPGIRCNKHTAWLAQDPLGADILAAKGTTGVSEPGGVESTSHSFVAGPIVIASATQFRFEHSSTLTKTINGLGDAGQAGSSPITTPFIFGYAEFIKIA